MLRPRTASIRVMNAGETRNNRAVINELGRMLAAAHREREAAGVVQLVDGLDEALAVGAAAHQQPPAVVLQRACRHSVMAVSILAAFSSSAGVLFEEP